MENKPFWEQTYADSTVSTFSTKPTKDIQDYYHIFPTNSLVLDVGCGEGRNSMFMAKLGNTVDAFDISQNGIKKAEEISKSLGLDVNFFCLRQTLIRPCRAPSPQGRRLNVRLS